MPLHCKPQQQRYAAIQRIWHLAGLGRYCGSRRASHSPLLLAVLGCHILMTSPADGSAVIMKEHTLQVMKTPVTSIIT